eukprot:CAMPEP_0182907048 /NCGR_PEP_ID=MMETSP0034_2-20130328/34208_1 /TAXON_ID=156128 /ORGANISM="Nephroselmis pyriformis, Strain CCMP717" /LENGTH=46 /DNA_ID= /DNA_START= /DNA_END= /DNA_ORIENTATION=
MTPLAAHLGCAQKRARTRVPVPPCPVQVTAPPPVNGAPQRVHSPGT